jgi:hypothetical protein
MKALIFLMTETLQDIEASQERLKHLLDPPGRSAQWPIYVNSREDYDKLPLGTWVMDTNGYVVQRGVPIPTVVTKEDYNAVPLDATYRWQGQFYLKGTSPWQGPVDTTPSPTPWQSPPPAVVSTHSSGSTDYTPGPQHPMSGGLFVLLAILVGLFVFLRSIRRPQPQVPPKAERAWEPPPQKAEPRTESQEPRQPRRVTSLRDAFDILGIPISSIEQARFTYRVRMSEYHPDKVASLGKELRQLAALKSVEFNTAMDFIASYLRR